MTKFTVVNDIHIGSKYCDDSESEQKLFQLKNDGLTVLNGDIVDLSCCPNKDVKGLKDYQKSLLLKWGDKYISGNHDLIGEQNIIQVIATKSGNKVLFTHGDLVKDAKKWSEYRYKKAGAGFLKLLWVAFADTQDWVKDKINTSKLEPMFTSAATWANDYDCKYIVMGHLHPRKKIEIERDGVTIIILPKGFNTLEIE